MKAYLDEPELKVFVVEQLEIHKKMDDFIKQTYWIDGRGCAVGCTLESVAKRNGKWKKGIDHEDHALYESELGIPKQLAHLQDAIFEGLPDPDYKKWPLQFAKAIKPGVDLSGVWPKFVVKLLTDPDGPIWPSVQGKKHHQQLEAVKQVANLYQNGMPDTEAADAAAEAAEAAKVASWAARAAARAAARVAAWAAAMAAEAAAEERAVAWAVEATVVADAYQWQRDTLIKLLKEAN